MLGSRYYEAIHSRHNGIHRGICKEIENILSKSLVTDCRLYSYEKELSIYCVDDKSVPESWKFEVFVGGNSKDFINVCFESRWL